MCHTLVILGLSESIWSGTIGVAFIYDVFGGSNTRVGIAEALQGLTSLASAFPTGWAADKCVCSCSSRARAEHLEPTTLTTRPPPPRAHNNKKRYSRSRVIAVGGVANLAATVLMVYATIRTVEIVERGDDYDDQGAGAGTGDDDGDGGGGGGVPSELSYRMICGAFALFGFSGGIVSGPAQALLADSVPTGQCCHHHVFCFDTPLQWGPGGGGGLM